MDASEGDATVLLSVIALVNRDIEHGQIPDQHRVPYCPEIRLIQDFVCFKAVYLDAFVICNRYTCVVLIERQVQDAFRRRGAMQRHLSLFVTTCDCYRGTTSSFSRVIARVRVVHHCDVFSWHSDFALT